MQKGDLKSKVDLIRYVYLYAYISEDCGRSMIFVWAEVAEDEQKSRIQIWKFSEQAIKTQEKMKAVLSCYSSGVGWEVAKNP